ERVRIERARLAFFMDPRAAADDFTGRVRPEAGMEVLLPALVGGSTERASIAVTAIERAAGGAFAGFARRVLRIQRKEDLAEAGDARERGTLVHRALSAAFEAARDAVAHVDASFAGAGRDRAQDDGARVPLRDQDGSFAGAGRDRAQDEGARVP